MAAVPKGGIIKTGESSRPKPMWLAWATVYLSTSSVQTNVPDPSSFTLSFELSFKPHAAHHTYDVRVLGADQTGLSQGPG